MSAEIILATLYSATSILISVSILVGGFYLLGHSVVNLLRLPTQGCSSINIAVGVALVTFFGWYAHRLGIPLPAFIDIVFFIIAVQFTLILVGHKSCVRLLNSRSIYIIPCFSLAFALQALIAFNETTSPVGTLGNNDLYDWSILAEHLLGAPGYDNVFTVSGGSAQQNRIDSFGTFFIIAICAKFLGTSALEASTVFTIFCLSLIGLTIYEVVKKTFLFNDIISFGIALLTTGGSFFFYIAYHNFYGQLLATFFYLTTLSTLLHSSSLYESNGSIGFPNFLKRVTLPVFSLVGILLVYQSGFFVFTVFSIAFCVVHAIFYNLQRNSLSSIPHSLQILLLPFLCGIVVSMIFLPELAKHTVYRTMDVKSALNGWPLPLINPAFLFSVPLLQRFPASIGTLSQYLFVLSGMIFIFTFAYRAAKQKNNGIASRFLVISVFFCLAIGTYLLAYYLKGGIYQVWKLASFVILPTSFMFYVGCTLILQQVRIFGVTIEKTLVPLVVIGCIFVVVIIPSKLAMTSITNNLEKMKQARSFLLDQGVENVVLDSIPFNEAYMAFNVFSPNFKVFPLVQTYVAPVDISVVQQLNQTKTRALVSSKCYTEDAEQLGWDEYKIIPLRKVFTDSPKYIFGLGSDQCSKLSVQLMEGFSVREPWGIWSEGNKLRLQIDIPPNFVGNDLKLFFKVHPFGASQAFSITVGGHSTNWTINRATKLSINIPSKSTSQKYLLLDFYIANPISPISLNSALLDSRRLGIGFISLSMDVAR